MKVKDYGNYLLSKGLVTNKQLPYYISRVKAFLQFCQENAHDTALNEALDSYLSAMGKRKEQWQVNRTKEAVSLFHFFEAANTGKPQRIPLNISGTGRRRR